MHNKIIPTPDGPLHFKGSWNILGSNGDVLMLGMFLCRCVHSKNSPFCDGVLNKIGLISE